MFFIKKKRAIFFNRESVNLSNYSSQGQYRLNNKPVTRVTWRAVRLARWMEHLGHIGHFSTSWTGVLRVKAGINYKVRTN